MNQTPSPPTGVQSLPIPPSPEEQAHQQMRQWLQSQVFSIMQGTRMLKANVMMAVVSEELPTATRKWLFKEFLEMAQIVEVKE